MKQLSLIVLTLILLAGCAERPRPTVKDLPPPPAPAPPPSPARLVENPLDAVLRDSTAVLRELTSQSDNAVPDALLNRTRCFIFVLPGHADGLSSCRSAASPESWSSPEVVTLSGFQPVASDSLIFVLSARAANALSAGNLDVSQFTMKPGPTERQNPLLTAQDLAEDVVTFAYAPPELSGAPVPISSITRSRPASVRSISTTAGGAAEIVQPVPPKLTATYLDWVMSYFNSIMPTGIVIHHTATVPFTGRVPAEMSEIDRYHFDRGFEIECFGSDYHVAYHYLILPDGSIKPGRPERCEGAHARAYNSYLGISLVGDFSTRDNPAGKKGSMRPTRRQLKSLLRLTRELQQRYHIPLQRILRHSDVAPTDCPGDRFAFKTFLLDLEKSEAPAR